MKPPIEFRPSRNRIASHKAWIDDHPKRSAVWFDQMMMDGFVIHHIDGDETNNTPDNLIMIEGADHAKLHRVIRAVLPTEGKFDRNAYQREYMRKVRARKAKK